MVAVGGTLNVHCARVMAGVAVAMEASTDIARDSIVVVVVVIIVIVVVLIIDIVTVIGAANSQATNADAVQRTMHCVAWLVVYTCTARPPSGLPDSRKQQPSRKLDNRPRVAPVDMVSWPRRDRAMPRP
jgi:hypothetical protein